jgi:hypothetical protein
MHLMPWRQRQQLDQAARLGQAPGGLVDSSLATRHTKAAQQLEAQGLEVRLGRDCEPATVLDHRKVLTGEQIGADATGRSLFQQRAMPPLSSSILRMQRVSIVAERQAMSTVHAQSR